MNIDFQIIDPVYGIFSDCLRDIPDDTTAEEIERMKKERFDRRMEVIRNPVETDLPMELPE